jgi:uncharacterized protein (DUF1499 family)
MTWLPRLALALAIAAAILLPLCGLGTRFGWWDWRTGLQLLRWCAYASLAAGALALGALLVPRLRAAWRTALLCALVISFCVASVPLGFQSRARSVPAIHDISTDTENAPAFVAVAPLRKDAPNPTAYPGREIAEQQKRGYPDLQPLVLQLPPPAAFERARAVAEQFGWEVVAADAAAGRIEATATTFWFGFKDDVVIRIAPAGGGSRVDVRSVSRVGRSDLGANARRIRDYLGRLSA